jgi:glutathione S-transferase
MSYKMIGKLYTFRRCPYAIRARMILKLADLKVEEVEVDLKNKPIDLIKYSPKGTVPVLVLSSGKVIEESLDIIDWVITNHKPKEWRLLAKSELDEGEELMSQLTDQFIPALNRYKYAVHYKDVDIKEEERTILQYLEKLESIILSSMVLSEKPTKYDIAIFPFVRQANIANPNWLSSSQLKYLNEWFNIWLNSSIFIYVMKK